MNTETTFLNLVKQMKEVSSNTLDFKKFNLYAITFHSNAIEKSTLILDLIFKDQTNILEKRHSSMFLK